MKQTRCITQGVQRATPSETLLKSDNGIPEALQHFDQLPDSAFVRLPTVCGLFGQCRSNIWRNVKLGRFPAPKKLSARVTAWQVGDLRRTLKDL